MIDLGQGTWSFVFHDRDLTVIEFGFVLLQYQPNHGICKGQVPTVQSHVWVPGHLAVIDLVQETWTFGYQGRDLTVIDLRQGTWTFGYQGRDE